MEKRLIQIYTGDGKGKTTAAFGQALRAAGRGWRVVIMQFFKSRVSGEVLAIRQYLQQIKVYQFTTQQKFTNKMNSDELALLKKESRCCLPEIKAIIAEKACDLLILDEILYPIKMGFLSAAELTEVLLPAREVIEIILTGRGAPPELVALADLVTEMRKIKHPYDNRIGARQGIEY